MRQKQEQHGYSPTSITEAVEDRLKNRLSPLAGPQTKPQTLQTSDAKIRRRRHDTPFRIFSPKEIRGKNITLYIKTTHLTLARAMLPIRVISLIDPCPFDLA
jgi:hypothetical protein